MRKLLILLTVFALASCNSNQNRSGLTDSTEVDTGKKINTTNTEKKVDTDSTAWKYEADTDKMTSKLSYFAIVNSSNQLQFAAPYDGGSSATVTVRNKAKTNEIILSIDKGQFICDVSEGCAIKVRFDSDKAIEFSGTEPADYSSTTLFIHPANKFIAHAKKSKKMIVEAEFYQEGLQDMEFDVNGFKWEH